ncbi:hypothetical protein KP509_24G057800 [Ceratopteris richardii]|uniref:Uncharacterized protein n=1 Tax=Ceratopteris richardii TaxID=49495 RepID=A0A8T2RVM3_CERRI|nr:hypothetical protein KP509_24G057800 [Ceratopteris richardii]
MAFSSKLCIFDKGSSSATSLASSTHFLSDPESSIASSSSSSVAECSPSPPSSYAHFDPTFAVTFARSSDGQLNQVVTSTWARRELANNTIKKNAPDSRRIRKCTCKKPVSASNRALIRCRKCHDSSVHQVCCRCLGSFAADCAAICCCPCAVFSLLAMFLIHLPSALAKRAIGRMKKTVCGKKGAPSCDNNDRKDAKFAMSPPISDNAPCKENKEAEALHIVRFDSENLLKYFGAEHVGFGSLSHDS